MSNEHKGKTAVKYDDLEDACSFVSAAGSIDAAAYLCRESGKIYFESDEFDDSPELPENIGDIRKFVTIPDKFELGLGQRLVFRFIREILPEHYHHVSGLFRRRGAYARFKDYLFGLGKLDEWYGYENSATEEALRHWAEEEGFLVEPLVMPEAKRIFQFRVELKDLEPSIWRRIQVPQTYSFWGLHVAIQDAMGWLDCHLHAFRMMEENRCSGVVIGIPDKEFEPIHARTLPGWETPVADYFNDLGATAHYEYDFGDGWVHEVVLEGVLLAELHAAYPLCIGGERACPPEDCGGPPGYGMLIQALANPDNQESKELLDWMGKDFDPDSFTPGDVRFDDPKVRWEKAFQR